MPGGLKFKIASWFVILLLVFGLSPVIGYAAPADPQLAAYQKVSENNRLALYANFKTGEVAVRDKQEGQLWMSNPPDWSKDKIAFGQPKSVLQSQITVRYADPNNTLFTSTSKINCINKKGLKFSRTKSSITFTMDFTKEQFKIPLRFSLGDDYLKAEILTGKIVEYGNKKIIAIGFLPYFGAGGMNDSGYLMVPDGSGAIINFNNGKTSAGEYSEQVYGDDPAFEKDKVETQKQDIRLPVFGMKKNDTGFLAIIESNEANAVIKASVGGKTTSYNNIYTEFQFRSVGSMVLPTKNWQEKDITIVERLSAKEKNYIIRYCFLGAKDSDYSGMAGLYRNYLIKEKKLKPIKKQDNLPFYVDVYGFIKKKKPILGIPFTKVIPLTTFEDCREIAGALKKSGVDNVIIRFNGWARNGYFQKIPLNARVEGKIGGEKGFRELSQYMEDIGGKLFLNTDLMNIYEPGNGFSRFRDAVMSAVNIPVLQYLYNINIYTKDYTSAAWYLLSPGKLTSFADRFTKAFKNLGTANISLDTLGRICTSDLGLKGFGRWNMPSLVEEVLGKVKSGFKNVMVDGGNEYAAVHAGYITNAPVYSSGFDLEDEAVPFYEMVFHGLVSYSGIPVNLSSNPELQRLKCLETGSSPIYSWIARDNSELQDTVLNVLYGTDYRSWTDSAIKDYKEINAVLSRVADQRITALKKLQDGVYQTAYGNVLSVVVNYNGYKVSVNGRDIEGSSYIVLEGEGR